MDDKRTRFVRLAEGRVPKAMKSIRVVGNLANEANYEFSDEDVKKIVSALQNELNELKRRFNEQGQSQMPTFKL